MKTPRCLLMLPVVFAATLFASTVAFAQGDSVPISVSAVVPDVAAGTVTFTLQNGGSKTVTAWKVRIESRGEQIHHSGFGVDAYRGFVGLDQGPRRHIPAGQAITVTTPLRYASTDVGISPTLAIFEDGTFAGPNAEAQQILERRANERAAWAAVVSELEATLNASAAPSVISLEMSAARMQSIAVAESAKVVRRLAKSHLDVAVDNARRGRGSPREHLEQTAAWARRYLAALSASPR